MAVVVLVVAGIATLLYPSAASWFSTRSQLDRIAAYADAIASIDPAQARAELRRARRYNERLGAEEFRDPFAVPAGDRREASADAAAWRTYRRLLDPDGRGVMGVLAISSIDVELPIYHGSDPATLERGIGHVMGTALPVGGAGTHSVLTGHSGLVRSTLLTHLEDVALGDTFTVSVMNHELTYQVDRIATVLPDEVDQLRVEPGADLVTLITCTPTGVNTHRLLVRGHRVPTTDDTPEHHALRGRRQPPFPWWLCIGAAALVGAVLLSGRLVGPPSRSRDPVRDGAGAARRAGRGGPQ